MRTERAGHKVEGEDSVSVRGGDNRAGEGSGNAVDADQASSVVTHGQSETAAEGTHPVLCTGGHLARPGGCRSQRSAER